MIKDQVITEDYAIYNGDSMKVLPTIKDRSADLIIYSPPFTGLYKYSSLPEDLSNCKDKDEFLKQYEFFVKETARLIKPGRIVAVHTMDIINTSTNQLYDFPHDVIELHEKHGMTYVNKITIWKEPLTVRMRTMVKSLTHKTIVEDSTKAYTAAPDYLLIFRKTGDNEVPVTHERGFTEYFGANPMINDMEAKYGTFEHLKKKYAQHEDPKTNKLSHIIWQRYASSVWDDIRIDNVLPFRESKEEDDEAHVHPLQQDVIQRVVELYTNPGEVVLTPFMGVGSEVYAPVKMGRKGVGIELKPSYFKQAIANLQSIKKENESEKQLSLI
jgi:DNA modification methylase